MSSPKVPVGLRIARDDLNQIKHRADVAHMSMTAYMVACSLGTIEDEPASTGSRMDMLEDELEQLKHRFSQLEQLAGSDY